MKSLINEWKEYFDNCLEQRYNMETKDAVKISSLLFILSAAFAFNATEIHDYFFKITYIYFAVVMALVTIFWIFTAIMTRSKNPRRKAIMRFCSKGIYYLIFVMLAIFLVIFKYLDDSHIKKYPKSPDNILVLFSIIVVDLLACYAFFRWILTWVAYTGSFILHIAEKSGYQLREGALTAFLLVLFLLVFVIIFEKLVLHAIRWYKQFRKIPSDQIRYDELYYKCNLKLCRIFFLMLMFVMETFSPAQMGTINQGDFINALTVWTFFILCNDKRKEFYARLETNEKIDGNVS